MKKKKILYLFSETGGGHRAAANALIAAVDKLRKGRYEQQMVDVFATCSGFLNIFARLYSPIIKYAPQLWGWAYYMSDDPNALKTMEKIAYPFILKELSALVKKMEPDLIVSVHPMVNHLAVKAIRESGRKIPLVVVVMDPVTFHRAWITPDSDLVIVATPEAKDHAIEYGMPARKVKIVGLPINPRFYQKEKEKGKKRRPKKKPFNILMMGGGEGSGQMDKVIFELDKHKINGRVTIICGRNKSLELKLKKMAAKLSFPLTVYGFTDKVADIMADADMIITKGGPGSIAEALAMDLPMVINSWLPGQEEGNVEYVIRENVGRVSRDPKRVAEIVRELMTTSRYREIMKNIRRIRRPKASLDVAKIFFKYL